MEKNVLDIIFEAPVKIKLFKLFLRNPERRFRLSEAVARVQSDRKAVRKQIQKLRTIGFLKTVLVKKRPKPGSRKKIQLRGYRAFYLNPNFRFNEELRGFILKAGYPSRDSIAEKIKKIGRVRLAILTGIFTNIEASPVDILIVGDSINTRVLEKIVKNMEAETGLELNYALLTTEEFKYRMDMFDRFTRDVLEKPNEKLINKLNI